MDAIKLALLGVWAALKFLFWAVVERVTHAIYWHKEASREQLILRPRRPKDLYDNGYALFAYDVSWDAWRGYWRGQNATPGLGADEVYELPMTSWGTVPFHEVEFSDMPAITFRVRAVALAWCREQMPAPKDPHGLSQPKARLPVAEEAPADAEPSMERLVH